MRLIDADALQSLFNEVSTSLLAKPELCKDTEHMVRASLMTTEMIQDAPTIDAVAVVWCKDCVYWQDNNGGYPHKDCKWGCEETPDADDFCSYGERRSDDA